MTLARNLGLQVVDEGVGNSVQLRGLKLLGCHRVQGFYLSKPVSGWEAEQMLISDSASLVSLTKAA